LKCYFQFWFFQIFFYLKEEGHSKKPIFFVNTDKNLALRFQPPSEGFLCEIRLQRNPKFDIAAAILKSTQQPGIEDEEVDNRLKIKILLML